VPYGNVVLRPEGERVKLGRATASRCTCLHRGHRSRDDRRDNWLPSPRRNRLPRRLSHHPHVDKLALLRRHPVFGVLDAAHLDGLCTSATTRTYPRDTTVFLKGDPGTSLFAVLSGTIRIGVRSPDGRDAVFNLIREGEIFGEIALLDGQPRTADATAMTNCEVMAIDHRDFVALVRSQPEIALKIIEVLCARVRRTSQQVEDVLFLDLPGRLAKALLRLDSVEKSAGRGKVSMTQRELGQMIGMSRESTNKQLREWEERQYNIVTPKLIAPVNNVLTVFAAIIRPR
jgi:CRP/FNR family transcriptional regulator, cyclic AMP receptor protein